MYRFKVCDRGSPVCVRVHASSGGPFDDPFQEFGLKTSLGFKERRRKKGQEEAHREEGRGRGPAGGGPLEGVKGHFNKRLFGHSSAAQDLEARK